MTTQQPGHVEQVIERDKKTGEKKVWIETDTNGVRRLYQEGKKRQRLTHAQYHAFMSGESDVETALAATLVMPNEVTTDDDDEGSDD